MRILITNDDGIHAEGIRALASAVSALGEVVVVAPDREQSGCGHAITLHQPLTVSDRGQGWYAVSGTPTDCVNFGIHHVLRDELPDLVLSGINHGVNLGDDVTYSGTVGGAIEGYLMGVPSVALSQELGDGLDFRESSEACLKLLQDLLEGGLLEELVLLNVNIPWDWQSGVEVTTLGHRRYHDVIQVRDSPRGGEYFWIAGRPTWNDAEGTDQSALANGHISVTPMNLDLTDHGAADPGSALRRLVDDV